MSRHPSEQGCAGVVHMAAQDLVSEPRFAFCGRNPGGPEFPQGSVSHGLKPKWCIDFVLHDFIEGRSGVALDDALHSVIP